MECAPETSISRHFASLTDPRVERTREHRLVEIVTIALCAVLCGADDWVAIETFGQAKEAWLRTFLTNPHPPMPAFQLSRPDIADLAAYIAGLR